MTIETPRRRRSRLKNGLQTLLIMGGLALVLAVPAYLLAGGVGLLMSLGAAVVGALAGSWPSPDTANTLPTWRPRA